MTSGWRSTFQTLKEIGYDGPLTIEREIPQDPERQLAETVKQLIADQHRPSAGLMRHVRGQAVTVFICVSIAKWMSELMWLIVQWVYEE